MPNPITNFRDDYGTDLGNKLITKEYLMSVYPQIAANMITPELWVWGWNGYAQLGNNNATTPVRTPVTTSAGGANWKQVSCGANNASAIKTDGTLWIWGDNSNGNLGINVAGGTAGRTTPVTTFAGGTNWKQVSIGGPNIAAIKTDGTLWTWGYNYYGQLGINVAGTTTGRTTPVTTFAGGTNWKQVACGFYHTAAIKTDGTLWTWGYNYGCLGINSAGATNNRTTPVTTFAGGTNWKQVSCAGRFTSAIKTDGTLWVWGDNTYASLGINNTTQIIVCTPVTTFAGGTNWKQVACGGYHTAAIKTDGTLWTWGNNADGQLGINVAGNTNNRTTPVTTFAGGTNWKQVACSNNAVGAIKTDGTLWTWGYNLNNGQLGANTTQTLACTPVTTFAGGNNWKQISSASGSSVFAAIKTSDDLLGI